MANNKITVLNFTENTQWVSITAATSGVVALASGYLNAGQTSGFQLNSEEELFNVYFHPQGASGYLTASNVAPNSQVGVSITGGNEEPDAG